MNFDDLYNTAMEYFDADNYSNALPAFQSAYKIKNDYECLSNIGLCHMMLDDTFQANSIFIQMQKINKDSELPFINLGMLQMYLENFTQALKCLKNAQEKSSINPKIFKLMGECYMHLLNFKDAIPQLDKSLMLDYEYPEAHYYIAVCYFQTDDYYKSFYHFDWCLRYGYEKHESYYYLGLLYGNFNSYRYAVSMLRKSIEQENVPPRYFYHLASFNFEMKKYDLALEYIDKYLSTQQEDDKELRQKGVELRQEIYNQINENNYPQNV